nr:MAG TPA: hypothetical protein [Caudoviricetes sp.]
MKKVSVIVVYDSDNSNKYVVKTLTAIHQGKHVPLIRVFSKFQLEQATSFNEMYSRVLNLLKANNMYASYTEAFGRKFYDIAWVSVKTFAIKQFGYTEKGGQDD